MKWTFWLVTYNGMGGHPVLSFAPEILLAADSDSFGTAIDEFEVCAHVELAHGPTPGSDFLMKRFHDRLPTLPKSWFRRKKKRVEIAYHSHVGWAEDLLGGDFAAKKVPDVAVLRRACEEVAASLSLLKSCMKRSDDFDVGGFLGHVEAKTKELRALDDGEVLSRLSKAQATERERVARAQ